MVMVVLCDVLFLVSNGTDRPCVDELKHTHKPFSLESLDIIVIFL